MDTKDFNSKKLVVNVKQVKEVEFYKEASCLMSNGYGTESSKAKISLIGIRRQKNGRYSAQIRDRIRRKKVWLGTFDTVEEASQAYFSKKSEFEKLSQPGEKGNTHIVGAYRKMSGKYTSEITNPITKKRIWLGTFDNAEEASQAYLSKKLEFNSMQQQCTNMHTHSKQGYENVNCEIFQAESAGGLGIDVPISNSCNGGIDQRIDSHEIGITEEAFCIAKEGSGVLNSGLMADVCGIKSSDKCNTTASFNPKAKRSFVGIKRQTNGRYAAVIKDRVKHKIWFGTFDTIEEASQAYFSKKSEFEKLNQQGNKEYKSRKNCDQIQQPESPSVVASLDTASASGKGKRIDSHKRATHIIGAHWKKITGRYTSEIRNPISKKRIWLGSFDTAEEASHAYRSKKLEFQKLVKAKHQKCTNKQRKSKKIVNVNQGHENVNCESFQPESAGGSPDIYVPFSNSFNGGTVQSIGSHKIGTAEEAFHAYQSEKFGSQSSKEFELQSIMPTGQEDEDLWKGEWVQLPDDRAVMFSLKLGLPIIDTYGSLLGEFSTLDDLSICETEDGKHNCVLSSL